jgi:hypothetical protein
MDGDARSSGDIVHIDIRYLVAPDFARLLPLVGHEDAMHAARRIAES